MSKHLLCDRFATLFYTSTLSRVIHFVYHHPRNTTYPGACLAIVASPCTMRIAFPVAGHALGPLVTTEVISRYPVGVSMLVHIPIRVMRYMLVRSAVGVIMVGMMQHILLVIIVPTGKVFGSVIVTIQHTTHIKTHPLYFTSAILMVNLLALSNVCFARSRTA